MCIYLIQEEGLRNRTSTITFLIKYYLLSKKNSLDQSIQILDKLLDRLDVSRLPSAKKQLKKKKSDQTIQEVATMITMQ